MVDRVVHVDDDDLFVCLRASYCCRHYAIQYNRKELLSENTWGRRRVDAEIPSRKHCEIVCFVVMFSALPVYHVRCCLPRDASCRNDSCCRCYLRFTGHVCPDIQSLQSHLYKCSPRSGTTHVLLLPIPQLGL